MKLIPAIDLKDKKCVRLLKGNEKLVTIFNDRPTEQAIFFQQQGCKRLHIVDLDGAFGNSDINKKTIIDIRNSVNIPIQLGGGIKSKEDLLYWVKNGIDFLILGSLAIKESEIVLDFAKKFKNKIYISLDILKNKLMIKGWLEDSRTNVEEIIETYNNSDIKGFIFTDVSRDGMLQGINLKLVKEIIRLTKKPTIIGGGLSGYADLKDVRKLVADNLEGVIAGKSFYSGAIEIKKAISILNNYA